ncbi:hypothetical protein DFO66_103351 [Brevibacterium sanguinis]|uniref:Uncharacterized protein n=2 Tax=Brevibacterium TaxID=1696 RepID=A0A366INJ6_9MICO|nr:MULTISPECIES: hypothetical protein [Brevibacterium]RBP66404.1 hypothetical protein DFO66_103351 [Brevibacterium sanguinis]RBP73056.1 hypothetical protein DFO65_103351 [Brevibacterium celere]
MTDDLTAWLAERKRVHAAATDGPWHAMEFEDAPGDWGVPIIDGGEPGSMKAHVTAYAMTFGNVPQTKKDAESIVDAHNTLPRLLAAVEAVLGLHTPEEYAQGPDYCYECEHRWPCATVEAIRAALLEGGES